MVHNKYAISLILCVIFLPIYIWGQSAEFSINGYSVKQYNDESGLPQNSVKDICIGNNGQVWLSTEAGLVEYDGIHFTTYDKDFLGTKHSRMLLMEHINLSDTRFALTPEWEFIDLSGKTPKYDKASSEYILNSIHNLWASAAKANGFRDSFVYQQIYEYSITWDARIGLWAVPGISVGRNYIMFDSNLYYTSNKGIIWKYKLPKKSRFAVKGEQIFLWPYEDYIIQIDKNGAVTQTHIPDIRNLIWNRAERQVYIYTKDNRLYHINDEYKPTLLLEKIPNHFDVLSALYLESLQTIFLGSSKDGLLIYKKEQFKTFGTKEEVPRPTYYSLVNFSDTSVLSAQGYVVGQHGSVRILNPTFSDLNTFYDSRALCYRDNQSFYYYHGGDLCSFDRNGKRETIQRANAQIRFIHKDTDGAVWMSFDTGELGRLNGHEMQIVRKDLTTMQCMMDLTAPFSLMGTLNGLYLFNRDDCEALLVPGTENVSIRSIMRAKSGRIYVTSTDDGIYLLAHDGIKKLSLDQNNYLKTTHCILEDSKNRFWITCNKGLYCIPESNLIHEKPNKSGSIYYHYFGCENGFGTNEFNGGCYPCAAKMKNGDFVFPSLNGLVWFNPDSIDIIFPQGKLLLKKMMLDDTLFKASGDTLEIPRNFKRLELFLGTTFYGETDNIMLEYNTDGNLGNSKSWIPTKINSPLVFTWLKPGYTEIRFRVRTGFGNSDYTYMVLSLHREPKIWENNLFYPGLVLLIILLGLATYLIRTASLKRRNEMLEEAVERGKKTISKNYSLLEKTTDQLKSKTRFQEWLIASLVHDLRGPLRFISQYSGMYGQDEQPSQIEIDFLRSVVDTSKDIYSYSEQLLQILKLQQSTELLPEHVDFEKIIRSRINLFKKEIEWKKIDVQLHMEGSPEVFANPAALAIAMQNVLDNSIKNQKGGRLDIIFKNTGDAFSIEICDQGPGMNEFMLKKIQEKNMDDSEEYPEGLGLGIWLILYMVKKTNGHVEFNNREKGLCVWVKWQAQKQATLV